MGKGTTYNGTGGCFMELSFSSSESKKLNIMINRIYEERFKMDFEKRKEKSL